MNRDYLTPDEVDRLLKAARKSRHGRRDYALILIAYRHGLRVSEIASLQWDSVDLRGGLLHVRRVKNGDPSVHPLRGPELRALRPLQRESTSPYVFTSERGGPLATRGIYRVVEQAGQRAGLPWPIHPHMLRHACGYYLASKGQDTRAIQAYLGHRQIQHTVRYTRLSPARFADFWQD